MLIVQKRLDHDVRHAYIDFHHHVPKWMNRMSMPCEVAVKSVVPAIRAYLAKELTQSHRLRQVDTASLLGITQTAVSKYTRHVRGRVVTIEEAEEVRQVIADTANMLTNGEMSRRQLVNRFCEICKLVRQKGLMCELCRRLSPSMDISQCRICVETSDSSGCLSNV